MSYLTEIGHPEILKRFLRHDRDYLLGRSPA
jgi:hypothetical protein